MNNTDTIKLTQFAHGAGCGCKIAPQVLSEILQGQTASSFASLLVGNDSNDDAAVMDLGNGTAIISTADFFMPIVDDAFAFGQVAAANAISDVYAMGGKPLMALGLLGWPVDKLPASVAAEVIAGARSICEQASIPLSGGHSIDTPEPMFGLSVTGVVATNNIKRNNTAQAGDILLLTKPIGVGIMTTAAKRGLLLPEHEAPMLKQLTSLNSFGEKLAEISGVHAVTDVTGFGIIGHLCEMADGSGLSAELQYGNLPVIDGVRHYLQQRIVPDATYRNWNAYSKQVGFGKGVNVMEAFQLLPDPQTNGGLLIAVHPNSLEELTEAMHSAGLEYFAKPIGQFMAKQDKTILVEP